MSEEICHESERLLGSKMSWLIIRSRIVLNRRFKARPLSPWMESSARDVLGSARALARWFRRHAETNLAWSGGTALPGKESPRWRGRHRQHARRVRSPDASFRTMAAIYS